MKGEKRTEGKGKVKKRKGQARIDKKKKKQTRRNGRQGVARINKERGWR